MVDVRREPKWRRSPPHAGGYERVDDRVDAEVRAPDHEPLTDAAKLKVLAKAQKGEDRRVGDLVLRRVHGLVANRDTLPDNAIARLRGSTQWQLTKSYF